jgi:predicted dehydrogenase
VDNLVAVLDLAGGAVAIVDLSRNARYGDDVRTEILGTDGAIFVDLLPTGRTRLATGDGIAVVPGSEAADAVAAGVVGQAEAFAARIRGRFGDVPGAAASTRAVQIGRAVQESAATGAPIPIGP